MKNILTLSIAVILSTLCMPILAELTRAKKFILSTTVYEAPANPNQRSILRWGSDMVYALDANGLSCRSTENDRRNNKFHVDTHIAQITENQESSTAFVSYSIQHNGLTVWDGVLPVPVLSNQGVHKNISYENHSLDLDIYVEEESSVE